MIIVQTFRSLGKSRLSWLLKNLVEKRELCEIKFAEIPKTRQASLIEIESLSRCVAETPSSLVLQ